MSFGEPTFVCNETVHSGEIIKSQQNNGKRSFIISVDNSGKIEVAPSGQDTEMCAPQVVNETQKGMRCGKYRIRIGLLEDGESSDEEQEVNDVVKMDAHALATMNDRFVRIYNKNVSGKPSFVVLEDAMVRNRVNQTLHKPCTCNTCCCNAQQQTTPCDICANTGCQTDEFLLKYALRTQMHNGQSIGCQASDLNVGLPVYNRVAGSTSKRTLRHALQLTKNVSRLLSNQEAAVEAAATGEPATSVTISFMPQSNTQLLQQQQHDKKVSAANVAQNECATSCTSLSGLSNCACHNCRPQAPATNSSRYCLGATDNYGYFCRSQIQQHQVAQQQQYPAQLAIPQAQQQYPYPATAYSNCGSSCSLLRPAMAQTSLSCGQASLLPSHSGQHLQFTPDPAAMQAAQQYSVAAWPPQAAHPYLYYPVPTYSMTTFEAPQCTTCPSQPSLYGVRCNEQQQYVCADESSNTINSNNNSNNSVADGRNLPTSSISSSHEAPQSEMPVRRERRRKQKVQESPLLPTELTSKASQVTVRRLNESATNEEKYEKIVEQNARNKASAGTSAANKLYMARFGRTCLILKPTTSSMPPRPLAKRYASPKMR